jgi:TonB family protein
MDAWVCRHGRAIARVASGQDRFRLAQVELPSHPIATSNYLGLAMLLILSILVGMAALDDPASAVVQTPPKFTRPNWLTPPNGDDLVSLYPVAAAREGIEGSASIKCVVTIEGYLNSCQVVTETPTGAAFGLATVQASALWRLSPATRDGAPVESVITIPMNWKLGRPLTPAAGAQP